MNPINAGHPVERHELWFPSLVHAGRGYAFPCDAEGHVDLDGLEDRARNNYWFARTLIGRDVGVPTVRPATGA